MGKKKRKKKDDRGFVEVACHEYHDGMYMYLYVDLGSLSMDGTSKLGVGWCSLVCGQDPWRAGHNPSDGEISAWRIFLWQHDHHELPSFDVMG